MVRVLPFLTILLLATACTHVPESAPRPAPFTLWEAGLEEGPTVEVIPLLTGEVKVDRGLLLHLDSEHLHDRENRSLYVPVLAYLVRHPVAGDLLIDTGFDHTFAESGHGNFGGLAVLVSLARQAPGTDTAALLRDLDVDPASLQMIVLSHMHPDHTSGLPDLPKSVPVVVGEGALEDYGSPWYAPADHLAGIETIYELPLPGEGKAIDLLGDGSLLALPTPGHAAGHLSFLARTANGPVLLVCDASHTREGFEQGVAPGGVADRQAADASLETLRNFVAAHPHVRVKAGHEAADWDMERGIQDPL